MFIEFETKNGHRTVNVEHISIIEETGYPDTTHIHFNNGSVVAAKGSYKQIQQKVLNAFGE